MEQFYKLKIQLVQETEEILIQGNNVGEGIQRLQIIF
jgi:hypothetical protein